ncbi:hypothetical protein M422DRAFT_274734 [Sphaerobolus stellatus SS14]|uniref:F-box domain-containing protein n=1 Tax=Sphaerobolus stellatus (strain SS14) TaxID=990650 RepID=A0A0C9U5V3_SPHS4|nr:hypothetical protein M422DRAFT_274734 [Sphaerobolus stellatus SS14]
MSICKEQYSTSLFLSLPPEIIEPIAADIDSPADLLNLVLTCRTLHDIIVPFHLHFRKLSLNISKTPLTLWYGIIVKPRLASCFRTVHVAHNKPDEQGDFYPSILVREGEAYLARTGTFPKYVMSFAMQFHGLPALSSLTIWHGSGSLHPKYCGRYRRRAP